jgi:uncharacterized protein (DUF111 family)
MRATKVEVTLREEQYHTGFSLADVTGLIEQSGLSPQVRRQSLAVFQRLARAEAKVHGAPVEAVHFHESAIIDLFVDIVGVIIGLERLHIELLYASPVPLGHGQAELSHSRRGTLPLPAPATLELLSQVQAPIRPHPSQLELVTPTGAVLLTSLAKFQQPAMRLHRVGVGAGGWDLPWPNILRLWLGEPME